MPSQKASPVNSDLLDIEQEFELFPNLDMPAPIHFVWSDFDEFCQHYRQMLSSHKDFAKLYDSKVKQVSALRSIPVWIKKDAKIITTYLFDIYESHLHHKTYFNHDNTAPIDISFISPLSRTTILSAF